MTMLRTIKQLLNLLPCSDGQNWIIDGGCHIGEFAKLAINMFPESKILSFEPDPDSWRRAKENLASYNQIEIVRAALGADRAKAEFFRGPFSVTNSLLPRPDDGSKPYFPKQAVLEGGTTVDVVTIDEECASRGIKDVDILKLDLQGGELAALDGATALLRSGSIKVIIAEAVFIRKYQNQPLFWEIWRRLEEHGYTLYSLEDIIIGLYLDKEESLRQGQWNQCNSIFLSKKIRNILDLET